MKQIFSKKLLWACIFVIAVNGYAGYSVYQSSQLARNAEHMVDHTLMVIYKTDNILSVGKDIESALRAFVLTGDSLYLATLYTDD